jgi:hypothetical protein
MEEIRSWIKEKLWSERAQGQNMDLTLENQKLKGMFKKLMS